MADPFVNPSPTAARWVRPAPRLDWSARVLQRIAARAFPGCHVLEAKLLAGGLRNANFKLRLDGNAAPVVLRIYEHDPSLCQKEADLIRLVTGTIPVPEILYIEPLGWDGLPPFVVMRLIEGITFLDLKRAGDRDAIAQAAYSAGETLAAIGGFAFSKPGWLAAGPTAGAPLLEGANPLPRFIDLCLASPNLKDRVPRELRSRTHELVWSSASLLATLSAESRLVHGDFSRRNLLVECISGRWRIAAVLDWEFAIAGSPLVDFGNFLRFERSARPLAEPHFSTGYRSSGGVLPPDWRRQARLVDLVAICESLTHDELPEDVTHELIGFLRAATEV